MSFFQVNFLRQLHICLIRFRRWWCPITTKACVTYGTMIVGNPFTDLSLTVWGQNKVQVNGPANKFQVAAFYLPMGFWPGFCLIMDRLHTFHVEFHYRGQLGDLAFSFLYEESIEQNSKLQIKLCFLLLGNCVNDLWLDVFSVRLTLSLVTDSSGPSWVSLT